MRGFFSILLLLGITTTESFSQQTYQVDTTFGGGYFRFQMKTHGPAGFSNIIEEFDNSQEEMMRLFSNSSEEYEKRRAQRAIEIKKYVDSVRKISFTNIIGLTDAESQKFWPIYNNYSEKLNEILDKRNISIRKINNPYIRISQSESENLVNTYINSFDEESKLMYDYKNKFKSILGSEKLMLLYRAEYQFKLWMIRSVRQ